MLHDECHELEIRHHCPVTRDRQARAELTARHAKGANQSASSSASARTTPDGWRRPNNVSIGFDFAMPEHRGAPEKRLTRQVRGVVSPATHRPPLA